MESSYSIEIGNRRIKYRLNIRKKITILQGDSGTGKTTLINMVEKYQRLKEKSGITLKSELECLVGYDSLWQTFINSVSDKVIFIDDGREYVNTSEFYKEAQNTSNHYVIVTRDSIWETKDKTVDICKIREKEICNGAICNELCRIEE